MSNLQISVGDHSQLFSQTEEVKVGRSADCSFIIEDRSISRVHFIAKFDESSKTWEVSDNGSANGCWVNGVQITSMKVSIPIELRLGNDPNALVLNLVPTNELRQIEPNIQGSMQIEDVVIGKSADANFILTDVLVSRQHARLMSVSGNLIIEDLGSTNGTYVNGNLIRTSPVREGDVITLGNTDLTIREGRLDYLRPQASKTGGLYVNDLEFSIKGGKKLLSGINVHIAPGTLTAVIGPSGAGKSTFLKAIAGINKPTSGVVQFDGFSVYENFELLSSRIGLVPQDDVLHTTLKLDTALNYAAKLRLRVDGGASERRAQVESVIHKLELDGNRKTVIKRLSGGQRKRASVALELLTEPSLLILDEPTSGLDPAMDRSVMKTLRELATDERGVLVVTHSVAQLDICDDVLVLAPGGTPAYYGPPSGIANYFGTSDWADIFAEIKKDPQASYLRYLKANPKPKEVPPVETRQTNFSKKLSAPWISQFFTLCSRQVSLIFADPGYLAFLLVLPIVVGLLVLVVPGSSGLGAASNESPAEPSQLLSMLVIGATFMGASVSIRDLIGERPVFLRERSVGLPVSAYLSAKLISFGLMVGAMAGVLVWVTFQAKPEPIQANYFQSPTTELFADLALTALVAMVSGLLISAMVNSTEQIMPVFVVFVMAQLVLNGGLFQVDNRGIMTVLASLVIARWGFAIGASSINLAAISPSLDEDPLWIHQTYQWASGVAFLIAMLVIIIALTKLRLEGRYDR